MPLTQEQISAFTAKAKALGASDQQIMAEIYRKQQEMSQRERLNAGVQSGLVSPEDAFVAGADLESIQAGKQMTAQQEKQPLLTTIKDLLGRDTAPITGLLQLRSGIPGTKAASTKNIYDQLQGMLSLEGREKLKGSGAISDFEFKVLQQAASRLGRNMSNTEFRQTLEDLQTQLGNQPEMVQMQSPNGSMYSVDASEVEEAEKNGWKRI